MTRWWLVLGGQVVRHGNAVGDRTGKNGVSTWQPESRMGIS